MLDQYVRKIYDSIDNRYKVSFFAAVIIGFFAHGLALFNKYSFHDDVYCLFTVGSTFSSGRWMLYQVSNKVQQYTGGGCSVRLFGMV